MRVSKVKDGPPTVLFVEFEQLLSPLNQSTSALHGSLLSSNTYLLRATLVSGGTDL